MFVISLIILTAIGFAIQYVLGWIQIKHFTKHYTELRAKGRVAIGRKPSIFKAGTLVLLQLNSESEIEEARYMQGVTVFSKFKQLKGLEGKHIKHLRDKELSDYNKLLVQAILDSQRTYNIIENDGTIERVPSPMMRIVNKMKRLFKNEGGLKNELHR